MSLKARIELDNAQVLSVAMGLTSPMVAKVTRRVLTRAEVTSPVDLGNLRASHWMTMQVSRTAVRGRVGTDVDYAEAVHNGTRAHDIYARRANALSFVWPKAGGVRVVVPKKRYVRGPTGLRRTKKGVVLYVAKGFVRHPGTKGRPWLFRSLREVAAPEGFLVTGATLAP